MGKLIDFAEIGGICNMHHWLRGMEAPASNIRTVTSLGNQLNNENLYKKLIESESGLELTV